MRASDHMIGDNSVRRQCERTIIVLCDGDRLLGVGTRGRRRREARDPGRAATRLCLETPLRMSARGQWPAHPENLRYAFQFVDEVLYFFQNIKVILIIRYRT